MKKIFLLIILFLPTVLFAGGGFYYSSQGTGYPFIPEIEVPSYITGIETIGGFGYGVDDGHLITGGFGFAFRGDDEPCKVNGGIGGIIRGYQIIHRPVHLGLMLYAGLGGVHVSDSGGNRAYFIGSFEADAEVGLPITSWFMPTVYAGYHWMGNFTPGNSFESFVSYGPVTGVRFSFGDG